MLDMKFVRENPELVKENIRKKFQDEKLPLVDQVIELDERRRAAMTKADELRANRNKLSKEIGALMAQGKKEEGMALRQKVADQAKELEELTKEANELNEQVTKIMMTIPNIIDPSVPIGKDDSENVEVERFGEPVKSSSLSIMSVWCRTLRCRTIRTLWSVLTVLIWTLPARWPVTAFIT